MEIVGFIFLQFILLYLFFAGAFAILTNGMFGTSDNAFLGVGVVFMGISSYLSYLLWQNAPFKFVLT